MRKTLLPLLLFVALMLGSTSQAQAQFQIAPRVGLEVNNVEALQVGVEARFATESLPVLINPSFDYYFLDCGVDGIGGADISCSFFSLKANGLFEFGGGETRSFTPYAGGGLAIGLARAEVSAFGFSESTSDTEIGLNLVGGARFETGNLQPFAQLEVGLGGADIFSIVGGLLFNFGN